MPITYDQEYAPGWKGSPPHMIQGDLRVWHRSRDRILKGALRVMYDVGVGSGQPAPPGTPEELVRMWLRSTQRRIDVLVEYDNYWNIIELRENAKEQELGRLEMYEMLYNRSPINEKPTRLVLISGTMDADIAELAKRKGIEFIVV